MAFIVDNQVGELLLAITSILTFDSIVRFSSWGWLIDAYAAYPMQEAISGCGNKIGIIGGKTVYDKAKRELNAWCYKNAT